MNLYLMRHAEAVDLAEAEVDHDADRALTEKGQRQAERVGRLLKRLDVTLDLVLVSPLIRARKSAQHVLEAMNAKVEIKKLDVLEPDKSGEAIWKAIVSEQAENVLVVGHLPSISNLARVLLGSLTEQPLRFHKSSVAALRCDSGGLAPRVTLEWMLSPAATKRLVSQHAQSLSTPSRASGERSSASRHG